MGFSTGMDSLDLLSTVADQKRGRDNDSLSSTPEKMGEGERATKKTKVSTNDETQKPAKRTVAKVGTAVKPKRPLTAYNFFFQNERAKLLGIEPPVSNKTPEVKKKRKHRKTHGKYGFTEMSRIISQKWSKIDDETRALYVKKQEEDAKRYKEELADYKKTLSETNQDNKEENKVSPANGETRQKPEQEYMLHPGTTLPGGFASHLGSMGRMPNANLMSEPSGHAPLHGSLGLGGEEWIIRAMAMQRAREAEQMLYRNALSHLHFAEGLNATGMDVSHAHLSRQINLGNMHNANGLPGMQTSLAPQQLRNLAQELNQRQSFPKNPPGQFHD